LFFLITAWQAGIIITSNYAFLNYLVLVLGFLLLDDQFLSRFVPASLRFPACIPDSVETSPMPEDSSSWKPRARKWTQGFFLTWIFYATSALMLSMVLPLPLPAFPIRVLEPFRFVNQFGLFAVMTRQRYEIEFQGSNDGENWTPYPFRYKPQALNAAPRIYAPYQPRFDWNLWFASLGRWRQYPFVVQAEERLLVNEPVVLQLFAGNPFLAHPPRQVRAVLWQYWFSDWNEKREQGLWWRREWRGLYAPVLERTADGKNAIIEWPGGSANAPEP